MKRQRKLIHLEIGGKHYFFGSLKALCNRFGQDQLGLDYTSIKCLDISPEHPYTHPQRGYIIRTGVIETAERKEVKKNNI